MVVLKKQLNQVEIIGRLKEVKLEEGTNFRGNEEIKGYITVLVKDKDKENQIRVQIQERKYNAKGNISGLYSGAIKVRDEYVSMEEVNEITDATLIKVSGELTYREYYNNNDQLVKFNNIKGRFYHSMTKDQVIKAGGPKAIINVEAVVEGMREETDSEGLPTDRLVVNLMNVNYFGDEPNPNFSPLVPIEAIVESDISDALENLYNVGDTGKFTLKINNYPVEEDVDEEKIEQVSGFGNTEELNNNRAVTKFERNYEIIGGTEPFMDNKAFEEEDLEELAKWKEKAKRDLEEGYVPTAKIEQQAENAFGQSSKKEEKITIEDSDIPDF